MRRRSVALIVETSNAYARGLIDGVIAYQREHDAWSICYGEQMRGGLPPSWIRGWKGDGIIARIESTSIASAIRRMKTPTVDVSAARLVKDIPWVETDDTEIATLAAQHLLERGFDQLAFLGDPNYNWSCWRREEFLKRAKDAGCQCHEFSFPQASSNSKSYSWTKERRRLKAWVEQLPKPIGVFACYDFAGQRLIDVCRELDVSVPEQMAVLGVDNDIRLCQLCDPPLSSVIPDTHQTGYRAAELLDSIMHGKKNIDDAVRIPPIGIAERRSTDVSAIEDQDIALALRFIREHACEGITVNDVVKAVPLSRRVLEHRFLRTVSRTPHAEIRRVRLQRACRLLRETDLSLAEISRRSGFATPEYFSSSFKKEIGSTPRDYRSTHKLARTSRNTSDII